MKLKACCGKPTCMKNGMIFMKATDDDWETCIQSGQTIMRLADDKCDNCGHVCRSCPPSVGKDSQERLLEMMVKSAQNLQKHEAGNDDSPLDKGM